MLVTPQDVTKFTPRLSPRAEQYEGTRLVFRIGPRSSSGSAFPIESGSDFAIGITLVIEAAKGRVQARTEKRGTGPEELLFLTREPQADKSFKLDYYLSNASPDVLLE